MADWIELVQSDFLTVTQMNDIYNNFLFLNQELAKKGYAVINVKDNSVEYTISPAHILEKMNNVEDNIQEIQKVVDWYNPYYSVFKWLKNTTNKKEEVDRWINYLNFTYEALSGGISNSTYLVDINGNYIVDRNRNYILVYTEVINEWAYTYDSISRNSNWYWK